MSSPDHLRRAARGLALAGGLLLTPSAGMAQARSPAVPASATAPYKTEASGLPWSGLTATEQQTLAPLAMSWKSSMSEPQKRKWLEISKNHSRLSPQAQAALNSRMNEWAALSPQQRAQARLNFGKTQELSSQWTPEEKKSQWAAYQALSPEEKQQLAAQATPRPAGAATAIKPVAPQKLATGPGPVAEGAGLKPAPKIGPSSPAAVPGAEAPQR